MFGRANHFESELSFLCQNIENLQKLPEEFLFRGAIPSSRREAHIRCLNMTGCSFGSH
jgi:hypothetical protein